MSLDLQAMQRAATVLLDLAVAVTAGGALSMLWLSRSASDWAGERRRIAHAWALAGVLVALPANAALLWLEAAAMAEVPLAEAGEAVFSMLTATHYGMAWSVGMGALLVAAALGTFLPARASRAATGATLAALAVFWYAHSMVSHAASEGDFSVALLANWAHLALISVWVGEVIVAGMATLAGIGPGSKQDRRARAAYVASVSSSATCALAGIFVTGMYSAWHNLGGIHALVGNPYGYTLLAKLAVVGVAALLGGFNRFIVMPPWLERECAGQVAREALPHRFTRVLQVEAVVLLAVLVLAAVLASTSPPGAVM
jgi:putative copper resistance protein D